MHLEFPSITHHKIRKYRNQIYLHKYFHHYQSLMIRDKTLHVTELNTNNTMERNNERS